MGINLDEIKAKTRARMAALAAANNVSTELEAVSRKETYQAKSEASTQASGLPEAASMADSFHRMFTEESTEYPTKVGVPIGEIDAKTGLVNDGGKAAASVLESFRKKQAIQAALGKGGVITKTALEAVNTKAEAFEVPDNLRSIEGLNAELFMANLLSVEEGVKASGENIQDYLRLIHANLTQYPELTHLLTDAQIEIIVKGFLKESNTQIKVATQRGAKSMAKITAGRSKTDLLNLLDMPAI